MVFWNFEIGFLIFAGVFVFSVSRDNIRKECSTYELKK
jgi:hypothetical protein